MKTKVEKRLRYLAAGIFFMALVLNVKFILDSPYFLSGNELVAQTNGSRTDTDIDTGTDTETGSFFQLERCWERKAYRITEISGTVGGGLTFDLEQILDTKLQADAGCSVSYEGVYQYEIICPATTEPHYKKHNMALALTKKYQR